MNHTYLLIHLLCAFLSLAVEEYFLGVDYHIINELGINKENLPQVRVIYILVHVLFGPFALILTTWDVIATYYGDDDDDLQKDHE